MTTRGRATTSSSKAARQHAGWSVVAAAVVIAGAALLVHGAAFRVATVVIEREKQVQVEAPPETGFPPFQGPTTRTITVKEFVDVNRPEPYLTRVAALGGLERMPSGRILEKDVESACPT